MQEIEKKRPEVWKCACYYGRCSLRSYFRPCKCPADLSKSNWRSLHGEVTKIFIEIEGGVQNE